MRTTNMSPCKSSFCSSGATSINVPWYLKLAHLLQSLPREDGSSSDAKEDDDMKEEDQGSVEQEAAASGSSQVTIKLNPKARKVGRPKVEKKKAVASEKAGRKWYEAAEAGRKQAGDATLDKVLESLERDQPGLVETQRCLAGVLVKFAEADSKKPKYKRLKNPVLILDAFYILPPKLLDACMAVLPVANTQASAIAVDDFTSQGGPVETLEETVHVKDIGSFSRKLIETFKRVQNLKAAMNLGMDMHKWLYEEGISSLPAHYHGLAKDVTADILNSYPYKELEHLSRLPDYTFQKLYRATPPSWLTDTALRACCERVFMDHAECRFAGYATARAMSKRTRNKDAGPVAVQLRDRILSQVREAGVDTIFLPVNFMNAHWCCIVIKVQAKRIFFFYDPLNQAPYKNACSEIATHLKVSGLQDYDVVAHNNPIQFDAFSCGVYVGWMFIRHAVHGLRVDMTATSLPKRRFFSYQPSVNYMNTS